MAGGLGGSALGFKRAHSTYLMGDQPVNWRYENVASTDVNPVRNEQFKRLVGAPAYTVDLFTRQAYIAFHSEFADLTDDTLIPVLDRLLKRATDPDGLIEHEGKQYWRYSGTWAQVTKWNPPSPDWHEVGAADMRRIYGEHPPDVMFASMPCQGNSRLLPNAKAALWKYIALNSLVPRAFYLCALAWPGDPLPVMFSENVPGIKHRSHHLLEDMRKAAKQLKYAQFDGDHDAGEIGGLAQSRPRHFWGHRSEEKVPQFVYQPVKKGLKAIKDVLSVLEMPGSPTYQHPNGMPNLHELPKLDFITWLRLALIRPGGDWKDIPGPGEWSLYTLDGREIPFDAWDKKREPDEAVWGKIFVAQLKPGAKNYPDMRIHHRPMGNGRGAFWVMDERRPGAAITGDPSPRKSGGAASLGDGRMRLEFADEADLRPPFRENRYKNYYDLDDMNRHADAIAGGEKVNRGAACMADVRFGMDARWTDGKFGVDDPNGQAGTVTGQTDIQTGAQSIADARLAFAPRDNAFVVLDQAKPSPAVPGNASVTSSNGPGAIADVRFAGTHYDGFQQVLHPQESTPPLTGSSSPTSSNGPGAMADPNVRLGRTPHNGVLSVWDGGDAGKTVTSHTDPNGDAPSVADVRMGCKPHNAIMGVLAWNGQSQAVIASLDVYAGAGAVEDQRVNVNVHYWPDWFPDYIIVSPWNAWHRPLTDLELAVLQGLEPFTEDGLPLWLEGTRKDRRQAIGNMVPPPASQGIAEALAPTLIVATLAKDAWMLSPTGEPIWFTPPKEEQPTAPQ